MLAQNSCVTCTDNGGWGQGKNGASWQWRTRRTLRLFLRNVHVLRSWVLNAADGWRHWERESNGVNVQKMPKGQEENQIKCKSRKHVVESLYKPGINYTHFHVRFNCSPWAWTKYLLHMAHPCAQCAHTHSHGAARSIMRMRTPSVICAVLDAKVVTPLGEQ